MNNRQTDSAELQQNEQNFGEAPIDDAKREKREIKEEHKPYQHEVQIYPYRPLAGCSLEPVETPSERNQTINSSFDK
jgi:hypothetical protein